MLFLRPAQKHVRHYFVGFSLLLCLDVRLHGIALCLRGEFVDLRALPRTVSSKCCHLAHSVLPRGRSRPNRVVFLILACTRGKHVRKDVSVRSIGGARRVRRAGGQAEGVGESREAMHKIMVLGSCVVSIGTDVHTSSRIRSHVVGSYFVMALKVI